MPDFKVGFKPRTTVNGQNLQKNLCKRFRDSGLMDVVEEFNKLKQEKSMREYQSKFKELKITYAEP